MVDMMEMAGAPFVASNDIREAQSLLEVAAILAAAGDVGIAADNMRHAVTYLSSAANQVRAKAQWLDEQAASYPKTEEK